ncbi:MAG: motif domain protein [Firmicutes bacterium]|nr:motif domain protein [Bacillota bacterium]
MAGRNDPCPCGSGKKYKKCCLGREQVVSLGQVRHDRAYRTLLTDLGDYGLGLPVAELERANARFFPPGDEGEDEELAENDYHAFIDWLMFDYDLTQTGESVVSAFAAKRSNQAERELLAAWAESRPGLYAFVGTEDEVWLLRDCFTNEEFRLEMKGARAPGTDAMLEGRLLPVGEVYRPGVSLDESTVALLPHLRPLLTVELERMRRAEPEAGWADLFRKRWPMVRDMLMLAATALEGHAPLHLPHVSPVQSLGQTDPPEGAFITWGAVADAATGCLLRAGVPVATAQSARRLWLDAANVLNPRITRIGTWAAGVVYTLMNRVYQEETTQADIAAAFSVSVSAVGARSREITAALAIEQLDERYVDPLEPLVRVARLLAYTGPPVDASLGDPVWAFGMEHPEELAEAQELAAQCQALFDRGDLQGVRRNCVEALHACPVFVPARNNLALCYMLEEDYRTAIDVAEIGLRTHPDYLFTLALLAEAHHRLGQQAKARERIDQAVAVYRSQQEQPLSTPARERASNRERLWEALASMSADRDLYELSLREEPELLSSRQLAESGVAAARCGDSERATEWLAAAIRAEPSFGAAAALADALARMRQGAVPAFELDYDFSLAPVEPDATALSPGVRARLVTRIWGKDVTAAEATVRSLAVSHDPWARQLLEAVALRPELPVSVTRCAAECLADPGERTGE